MVAAVTDVLYLTVPNLITFPVMIAGLLLCGFPVTRESYIRLAWMFVFFVIGYFRIMGMGDLKLCMAVISLRGIGETWRMLLAAAVLMLLFCIVTDTHDTIINLKLTVKSFIYNTKFKCFSAALYPFAMFLALGYTINIILS